MKRFKSAVYGAMGLVGLTLLVLLIGWIDRRRFAPVRWIEERIGSFPGITVTRTWKDWDVALESVWVEVAFKDGVLRLYNVGDWSFADGAAVVVEGIDDSVLVRVHLAPTCNCALASVGVDVARPITRGLAELHIEHLGVALTEVSRLHRELASWPRCPANIEYHEQRICISGLGDESTPKSPNRGLAVGLFGASIHVRYWSA